MIIVSDAISVSASVVAWVHVCHMSWTELTELTWIVTNALPVAPVLMYVSTTQENLRMIQSASLKI